MKKKHLLALWIIALAVGWTWMGPQAQAEEPTPPSAASQRAALFTETVRHLEMDGDVLVFLNTRNLFRNAMQQLQDLVRLLAETDTKLAPSSRVLAMIGEFLDESHRVRAFIGRDPAGADRALWRTLGGAPRTLEGVRLLPRDTVWAQDCNFDLNEAWRLLRRAVERIGGPQQLATMDDHLRSVQQNTAFDLSGLLAALSDEHFVSFQFFTAFHPGAGFPHWFFFARHIRPRCHPARHLQTRAAREPNRKRWTENLYAGASSTPSFPRTGSCWPRRPRGLMRPFVPRRTARV